jgi:DNA helicase-2/ATP-dependent DNA helicase PcrA
MSREYVLQPFRAPIELKIDYAGELNEQQHAAVTAAPGPALVIAGAGSGKTRTLTYRVAYLIEQGIPPERMLLLTFTNKAAKEMMRRVADLLGQELRDLWGGTFHSIGSRVLRRHAGLLGYEPDFSILDRDDAKHLVTACVSELQIDTKALHFPKADVLGDIFSMAVNTHKRVTDVLEEQYDYFLTLADKIEPVFQAYVARKRAANAMDFDDLLVLWLKLLQDNAEVREHYQKRFQFILVDEYQDTNKLQSDLIDLLAARSRNVMVVGDDAQSIYAWRGANYENIMKFPERYPESKVYKIETNYRSTPEVLGVANAVIAANVHQFTKELLPIKKPGSKPVLAICRDASEQAGFVAQRIQELEEEGLDLNKMAVLYRSHFHALELQLELTRRGIPFSITSGIRFFEQAHIKDVTGYLKLVLNPNDELAFKRLVLMLPGIGEKAAEKLWQRRRSNAEGGARSVELTERVNPGSAGSAGASFRVSAMLRELASAVPKKALSGWTQFVETVKQLEEDAVRGKAARMIELAVEAGYEDYLKETYPNYRSRMDDLKQLAAFAQQFETCEEFLTELALLSNLDADEEQSASKDEAQIRLSTIHQAKGLEFDVVFLIMLCEGSLPSARALETPDGEEEERRLMYVAVTRARDELYLSYPLIRAGYGNTGDTMQQPSRFLSEIPRDLLDQWKLTSYASY